MARILKGDPITELSATGIQQGGAGVLSTLTVIGNTTAQGDLTVLGDLTVSGTTTSLLNTVLETNDPIVDINADGGVVTDSGLRVITPSGGAPNKVLLYNVAADKWQGGTEGAPVSLVYGPDASTDNELVRFDGITGKIQATATTPPTLSDAGVLVINNATDSVSTATGALQVAGGIGVVKNIVSGGVVTGTTLLTGSISIGSSITSLSGNLQLSGTGAGVVEITDALAVDVISAGTTDGNLLLQGNGTGGVTTAHKFSVTNATDSSSTSTGALVVTGGVGVGGKLYVGDTIVPSSSQIIPKLGGGGYSVSLISSATPPAGATSSFCVGIDSGLAQTTADGNILLGYQTGNTLTSGGDNVAIGSNAMWTATSNVIRNVCIGLGAGQAIGSSENIVMGYAAGDTLGGQCVVIGARAGWGVNITTAGNVIIGSNACSVNTVGSYVTCLGFNAGSGTAPGDNSVSVGRDATGSGASSVAIGYQASASASESIAIGDGATAGGAQGIAIGDNVVNNTAGRVHIGGASNTELKIGCSDLDTAGVLVSDGTGTGSNGVSSTAEPLLTSVEFVEQGSAPSNPGANHGKVWVRNDAEQTLMMQDDGNNALAVYGVRGQMYSDTNEAEDILTAGNDQMLVLTNMTSSLTRGVTYEAGYTNTWSSPADSGGNTRITLGSTFTTEIEAGDFISLTGAASDLHSIHEVVSVDGPNAYVVVNEPWNVGFAGYSGAIQRGDTLWINNACVLDVALHASLSVGGGTPTISMCLLQNGTKSGIIDLTRKFSSTDIGSISFGGLVSCSAGDALQLCINSDTASNDPTFRHIVFKVVTC